MAPVYALQSNFARRSTVIKLFSSEMGLTLCNRLHLECRIAIVQLLSLKNMKLGLILGASIENLFGLFAKFTREYMEGGTLIRSLEVGLL